MQVLLIRNSGRPFLAHCRDAILAFLGAARRLAFVTAAALRDKAAYYMRWRALHSVPSGTWSNLRWDRDPLPTLARAEAEHLSLWCQTRRGLPKQGDLSRPGSRLPGARRLRCPPEQ